jgi:hypothetical protein
LCLDRFEELDGFEVQSFHTEGINSVRFVDPLTNLSCPVRGFKTSVGDISIYYDPVSFTYRECHCPLDYYWNDDLQTCQVCETGFHCNHTHVHDPSTAISVATGYYPLCNGTLCDHINRWPLPTLLECALTGVCNPNSNMTHFECAFGYDVTSMTCSRCLPSYYPAGGRCVACPSSPAISIASLTIVAVVVLVIGISQYEFEFGGSALPALIMFWFQVSSILEADVALRSKPSGDATGIGRSFASVFGLQDIAALDMSMVSCTSNDDLIHSQFERTLYLKILLFGILYVMVAIIVLIQRWSKTLDAGPSVVSGKSGLLDNEIPSYDERHDQPMRVRSFNGTPVAANAEPLLPQGLDNDGHESRCHYCCTKCGVFPAKILMAAYFLMESLFLPLVTHVLQVSVPCITTVQFLCD